MYSFLVISDVLVDDFGVIIANGAFSSSACRLVIRHFNSV
jgi:hypothetical protein